MLTPWGENLDESRVLPEYPRPQLRRESYINLNGRWQYAITASEDIPETYDGEILVPFSPEAPLSGVERTLLPGEFLWYRRSFSLPEGFNAGRVLLHFGAVDQMAQVWVNGQPAASHTGGYLPFTADITAALQGTENTLLVRVADTTDSSFHTRGKQKLRPGGIWYTPQSGIWQTVWLESVPESYIRRLKITPWFDEGTVEVSAETAGPLAEPPQAHFQGKAYALPARIPVPDFLPWTPENPQLYDFSVTFGADKVDSYFAMRKFTVETDGRGARRLFLNGRPYFQNGVLDQGYWPDGLYTAPDDEAMIFDIQTAKDMGFNLLRKHVKIEPLRWYYHCDRLGMLVWQDMPNGGEGYDPLVISAPLVTGRHSADDRFRRFGRESEAGRAQFHAELRETVELLYNCPCIALWVPFNEGWGQFSAASAVRLIREIDANRPIDHASGWHDQGIGQLQSLHVYFKKYKFKPDNLHRAVILSECGGYGLSVSGHTWSGKFFGYRRCASAQELAERLRTLYREELRPARRQGLAAVVYTQLTDVETEQNGLITYDRRILKLPAETVREIVGVLS